MSYMSLLSSKRNEILDHGWATHGDRLNQSFRLNWWPAGLFGSEAWVIVSKCGHADMIMPMDGLWSHNVHVSSSNWLGFYEDLEQNSGSILSKP